MSIDKKVANTQESNIQTEPFYNPNGFEFTPVEEMFDKDFDVESVQGMDEYMKELNAIAPVVNDITKSLYLANVPNNMPQNSTKNFSSFEGFSKVFNSPNPFLSGQPENIQIQDPIISGAKASGYDRLSIHPDFNKLGWNPARDNEAYYNANTSGWSDFQRAWGPWADSVATGFMSSYRAIADLFGGDSYFKTGDYQSAIEFAEANRLGSSTRGGLSGFGTNLFLQSGYTVGIIGSIAAEELALAAATAATGGGASGGFLARTIYNFGRGMKAMGNMFDVRRAVKTSSSILDGLRTAANAKDFWTAARTAGVGTAKFAGNIFTPELRATLKAFKTGENTIQGLEVLAKGATYGAFYRDLRAINMAMSEAKMEGGLVYSDVYAEHLAKNNGEVATIEDLEEINKAALDAASTTILLNAPFIYATNKLVLGTALSGFSPTLRRIFNQSLPGFAKNFIKSKPVRDAATGKAARDIFKNVGAKSALGKLTGFKKLRAVGIGKGTAHNLLRYSAASIGEGVQEVYQEGVTVGVVDYYTKLLDNPQANQTDLMYESIRSGLKSQMSAQGAEVFMSGFLMGGLVQGPQKVLFETIPEVYQRKRNPEAYKKYQENMEKFEARVNEIGNDIQDNPFDYFNDKRLNLFFQKDTQEDAERNLFEADPMGFYDAKDASAFMNRYFMMSSGTESLYLEQLEDISKLSKEELKEMFPQFEDTIEEGKGQEYIQRSIDDLKKFTKEYQSSYDKIVNPYNFKQFKKGSREYNQTRQKHLAVEHARLLYLFAGDSFAQALNRRDKLNNYLKTSGVMGDQLDTDDLTVLLSTDSIDAETKLLLKEVQVLNQAEEKDEKLIKEKEDRLIALAGYRAALENTYDAESDVYDREKIETLRKPLIQYLEKLAKNKGGFVKEDLIDEVLYALVDHNNLDKRAQLYSRTVSLFSNPDKVTDIIDRIGNHLKVVFDNNKAQFEKNVNGAVEDAEANQVVSQFKELGVYPDAAQVLEFLKTKDVSNLKDFYTENGKVFPQADAELWGKIQAILNNYTQTKEDLAKAKQEKTEAKKETATPEEAFDKIDSQEIPDDLQAEMDEAPDANLLVEDQSPFAQEILLNLYAKYKLDQFSKGEEYLPLGEWVNSREGRGAVKALEKLKKVWYVSLTKSNLTEEQIEKAYKEDDGFQSWLMSQKEDPLVSRALMLGGIRFSDVEMDATGLGLDSVVENDPNKDWIQKGPGVNILQRRVGDPTSEEDQKILYTLTDNNGVQLSDEELQKAGVSQANELSLDKAVKSFQKLLKNRPENSTYEFDGVELKYLDEVEDAQGNKFIVLGTSVSTDKGAKLKLLRFEDRELQGQNREAASFFAEETSFSDLYSKVEQSFKGVTFTENMSKLDPKDMSALYGRRLEGDTEKGISPNERLARALSVLSEEDLAKATIVIIRNDRREPIKLQIGATPQNTFVNDNGDKYHIEIVLEQDAANKVQDALKDSIYAYPEDFDGSIGFIANDQYSFTGVKGKEINISAIEDSKIERYITPEGSTAADLKNAAAQQAYFIGKVDELMKSESKLRIPFSTFNDGSGRMATVRTETTEKDGVKKTTFKTETTNKKGEPRTQTHKRYNTFEEATENLDIDLQNEVNEAALELVEVVQEKLGKETISVTVLEIREDTNESSPYFGSRTATLLLGGIEKIDFKLKSNIPKTLNQKAIKMAEFREATDFDIVLTNGKFEQGKEPVSLEELEYNTFDGNMIIMINTKQKNGSLGKSYVTNLEKGEAEFIASVEDQLKKQSVSDGQSNLFNEARTLGRYVAIIKSPNGAITLAQLKQEPHSPEYRVTLYNKLIEKAQDVRDGKVEMKDRHAWNDKFNAEFYIPINPNLKPSFLDLKIDSKGNIVLRIKVGKAAPIAFTSEVTIQAKQLQEYIDNPSLIGTLFSRLNNNSAVKKFNERSPYKLNFTEESLLKVFPIDATIDEIVGKTKTDLDRRVRFGQKVYMTTSADLSSAEGIVNNSVEDATSDEYAVFINTGNVSQETLERIADVIQRGEQLADEKDVAIFNAKTAEVNKILEERKRVEDLKENTDLQTMDDTLFEEFKKNDFQDISSDITRAIAAKVVSEGRDSLTDREAEVLKSREDIEALIAMASMQNSTPTEESTLDKQIEEAQQELEKEKALIEAEWAKTKKNRRVLKRESESYQAALNKLRALEKKRNDLNAFKVLDPTESFGEEYTLESFLVWAKENLPEFIQVRDLEELHTRLTERGIQVGQFTMYLRRLAGNLDIEGTIYTGVGNSYRYHEAFHAVYRLLLTDEEQAKLRKLAKDEVRKKFKTREAYLNELSRFKNLHPKYRAMSSKDLENEYLEEYMADEFEKFKTNPRDTKTNSTIKSFFNRLLQWIRSVLKGYRGNELTNLFEAIDSRKFKNAAIQDNIYTRGLQNDVIVDVFKIIPYEVISGDKMTSAKYLDPSTANLLIRMIGNTYVERRQDTEYGERNDKDLLGTVIDDYATLYNPEQEKYNSLSEKDFEKLENIYDALIMDEGEAVMDAVEQHLEIVNIKIEEQEDEVDQLEDEFGPRRVGDYNKDANQFGGYASAGKNIRMFIASVAIDSKDMFGNVEVLNEDGKGPQKIKVPVDHIDVYNGLMLAAMNKTNTADILKAMYIFSRRNEHSGAVVDEFFRRTGIDAETLMETNELPKKIKNSKLFNEFVKTFTNSRVDYIFHFEQEDNPSNVAIFAASNRDAANSQIDYWKKGFNDKFELFRTNRQKLNEAISVVNALDKLLNKKTITNKLLSSESNRLSKEIFDKLGIKLSPLYLEISIASSLTGTRTKYQEQLVQLGSDKRLMTSEDSNILVNMLSAEEIIVNGKKKTNIPKPQNLFIDDQGAGMSSRLKSIALGNALFDESVGNTVFEDPNGNLVYAHQKQTYHLKRINELNEAGTISDLSEQFELNSLLNNPIFRQMSKDSQLGIIRVAGLNAGKIKTNEEDNTLEDYTPSMGQTYGDFKSVDFIRTLINLYVADYNTKSGKNNIVEAEGQFAATAPVLIRILESANTGDMVSLPVSTTIQDGKITESTIDVFTDIIEKEYNIIRDNFEAGLGAIKNYNDTDQGNGFKFFKADNLISLETKADLIAKAKEGVQWKDISRDDIAKEVGQVLEATAQDFINLVKASGINVSSLVQGNFAQTDSTEKAMAELNLVRNNVEQNLKQIFLNNWMNTLAINELILGEEARLFKNAVVDPIKRAKMQNAAHDSVSFDVIPEEDLGIEHTLGDESIALMTITDPAFEQRYTNGAVPGNRKGDKADAQTYVTAKGARYFAYGLGQLNEDFAEMLDKIERGEEITSEDWFGKYQPANAYLNSKKYVYGDGQTFLKMSTVVLTKEETSVEVDGVFRPRPGMEELHYMRENMEAFEAENQGKVAIVAPTSAVKMLKQNILPVETLSGSRNIITQDEVTLLNARDFGRQMINPSNKLEITIPTQIKSLITSEQYQGEDFKVRIAGENLSMNDVRTEYHKLVAAGVRFDYTQKRNLIFDLLPHIDGNIVNELERSGSIEPNLATFIRSAQANLKASAAGSNMIEFFADENGEMKYDLNNPITISKFEQFFLAYFSKKVLAQKTPGMSLALKSDFGKGVVRKVYSLDAEGNIDKQEVIRKKNFDKSGQSVTIDIRTEEGMQELRDALANNPGQSVTVIDRLRINLPEYDKVTEDPSTWVKTNIRYAEAIIPAHYKEVMDLIENKNVPIPDAIAKMFAVRIPSQDKHSSMAVRLVDFDPVYNGSTGVFPEELIEISGADFDIDKVYTAIKEWYVKEGKFIEYGSRTGQEGFEDYVNYTNKKVAKKGSYLYDAASKYNQSGLVSIDKSFDESERLELENLGYSEEAIDALYVLNLPKTLAQYNKYIKDSGLEPYRAPMINRILDMNFALQGNTKLTESETGVPISYQPADVEALKEEWNTLSEQFPFLKALTLEEGISIDNLIGQYFTHKNVKENANLIGAVVPPNVIFNFLKEQGVSLRKEFGAFKIDDKEYNKLVDNEEGLKELRRSQYIISNLISAATDDAKERLLSKLGYVKKAIKAVETMVAYGVPLHTATMLINTDTIRRMISEDNYGSELKLAIAELVSKGIEPVSVTTESIENAMVAGGALEAELLGIYYLMNKVNTVVSFADEMISIFRLNNGFGKDFSSLRDRQQNIDALGLYIKGDVFKKMKYRGAPMPMDLRKAFDINTPMNEPTSHFIGEYLRINKEFTESILPQIFLTQTPEFKEMYESVMGYTYPQLNARGSKLKTKIHKDILAYITLKAYMKQVFETEAGAVIGASLSNEFIYPGESSFNINKVITDLRAKYQDRDNYFLDYFLYNRPFDSADNKTGMNTIVTNSFGKLSDNEKVRIQNGFQSLYGERETRADAMHILHYIMIKDGLQYDFGSVLDAITPFGLEKYLQASKNAFAAFKGDKSFEDVFGTSFTELSNELASNYGESTSHARNLVTVNTKTLSQSKHSLTQIDKGASIVIERQQSSDAPKLEFPRFMQIKDFVTGGSTYYRLTQAADVNGKESTNIDISATSGRVIADKVTYERFVPKGSFKQSAIGFMFDNENFSRPTLDKLQVGENREMFEDPFGGIDPMDVDDFAALEDFAYDQNTLAKLEAFNQGDRTATEKGIEIDGVNIADAKAPAGIEDATSKLEAFIQPTQQTSEVEVVSRYTNTDVKANANKIYVFGDNTQRTGTGGQAQIRNNENAFGIATKLQPNNSAAAFMSDNDLQSNKDVIDSDIAKIKTDGRSLVFPKDGLGTGLAKLKQKAPQTYSYLKQRLQEEFGFNNDTGAVSQPTQQNLSIEDPIQEIEEGEQLRLNLDVDSLQEFYEIIQTQDLDVEALQDAGISINSLESFRKSFESSKFTNEEEFTEHIKKCYLK